MSAISEFSRDIPAPRGGPQQLYALIEILFAVVREAAVAERVGVLRIERDRQGEVSDRLVEVALVKIRVAPIAQL
jgi:hypothetical protein